MGDKVFVQCQVCGHLHKIKMKDASISDDDLYTKLYCPRCRDGTKHLLIGEHQDSIYEAGDTFLDERYFIY